MDVIEVQNLSKSYYIKENRDFKSYFTNLFKKADMKEIKAVKDISFRISQGECVGLIGNNGAGKSTTIKMLTGILKSTNGSIKVLGNDPFENREKNNFNIAAVFGQRCQLRWDISPFESYKLLKCIYKVNDKDFEDRFCKLKNALNIESFMNRPVRTLSLGQKMRAELCAAFLHNPKIVFLDEPTIGLDIFSKEAILGFLKEIQKLGETTIILTTHDLADINELCQRIIIIEEGKILLDESQENINSKILNENKVIITLANEKPNILSNENKDEIQVSAHKIIINKIDPLRLPKILENVLTDNKVLDIKVENTDFKEIIKKIYSENGLLGGVNEVR